MTFRSTSFDGSTLVGDLTIKGVTKPVTLDVEFGGVATDPWGNEKAAFEAEGEIDRTDWGLTLNAPLSRAAASSSPRRSRSSSTSSSPSRPELVDRARVRPSPRGRRRCRADGGLVMSGGCLRSRPRRSGPSPVSGGAASVPVMADWSEVVAAVGQALGGDREGGRTRLRTLWDATGPDDHAQRCVLAHYLADLEPTLDAEVAWDERALEAFAHVRDDELAPVGIPSAAGMAPSLHLNLGDGYRRQERLAEARRSLEAAEATSGALGDDGYGAMLREGIARLRARLDADA